MAARFRLRGDNLRGRRLRGKTYILAPKGNSLAPAVIPIKSSSNVTVGITSVTGTGAVGNLAPSLLFGITNVLGTGAVGTLTAVVGGDITVAATNVVSTSAVGSLSTSISAALTNTVSTSAAGSVSPQILKGITNNAATGSVGSVTAGISRALTGNQSAGTVGNVAPEISRTIAGNESTNGIGNVSPQISAAITGNQSTGAVGSVSVAAGGDITLAISSVTGTCTVNGFPYGAYVEPGYGDPDYYEHMGVNFRLGIDGIQSSCSVGTMVATVYDDVVLTLTAQQAIRLDAVLRLHGLIAPLVVTPTSRGDGVVTQTLSGVGPVTVTTTALPAFGAPTPALIDKLARWYGLIDPMVEQDASRSDGTLSQTVITAGSDTTVTTI